MRSLLRRINGRLALIVVGAAAVLFVSYRVLRIREDHGHHPEWGDVPTWLTFLAAAVGVPFAVYQFALQRRQLTEQQRTIREEFGRQAKRDALLEEQLRQVQAANHSLMRQQAELIDLAFTVVATRDHPSIRAFEPAVAVGMTVKVHCALVTNHSRRPIRYVRCWIEPGPGLALAETQRIGEVRNISSSKLDSLGTDRTDFTRGSEAPVIRSSRRFAFAFEVESTGFDQARMATEFTDDAGLRWRIDHDLSLSQIAAVSGSGADPQGAV